MTTDAYQEYIARKNEPAAPVVIVEAPKIERTVESQIPLSGWEQFKRGLEAPDKQTELWAARKAARLEGVKAPKKAPYKPVIYRGGKKIETELPPPFPLFSYEQTEWNNLLADFDGRNRDLFMPFGSTFLNLTWWALLWWLLLPIMMVCLSFGWPPPGSREQ